MPKRFARSGLGVRTLAHVAAEPHRRRPGCAGQGADSRIQPRFAGNGRGRSWALGHRIRSEQRLSFMRRSRTYGFFPRDLILCHKMCSHEYCVCRYRKVVAVAQRRCAVRGTWDPAFGKGPGRAEVKASGTVGALG